MLSPPPTPPPPVPPPPSSQPSLTTETLVSVLVSPWLGAISDTVGRKALLVGAPILASLTWWAALLQRRRRLDRHVNTSYRVLCQISIAISSQAWQIGYGATVSDLSLDPALEQGIEVTSNLVEVTVQCLASAPASTALPLKVTRRCCLAAAAAMSGAAAWCVGTKSEEPLDDCDRKRFDSARLLGNMSWWRRRHLATEKAMLIAFLLESGRQQYDGMLEAGSHERALSMTAATAGLAASVTIKPTLRRCGDIGTTQLASWAHFFACLMRTPLFSKWKCARMSSAVITTSIAANGEYAQGSGQEDAALEAGCGHGEMNAAVCAAEAVSRQLMPMVASTFARHGARSTANDKLKSLGVYMVLHALTARVFLPQLWPRRLQ